MKLIKIILSAIIVFAFISLTPKLSIAQSISYDEEILLPENNFTPGAARDIIKAGNYVFVYTFKNIIIYSEGTSGLEYQNKIEFTGSYGHFAPMLYDRTLYAPDHKFMAFDEGNQKLFFVTPTMEIKYVFTNNDQFIVHDISKPSIEYPDNMTLHAYTKIEFNSSNNRLYWLIRTLDNNLHSYDSFFGVFSYDSEDEKLIKVYSELQDGSGDNHDLLSTFTFDPSNNTIFFCRKFQIEKWTWDLQGNLNTSIITTPNQERNSKMIYLKDKGLLLVFPYIFNTGETTPQLIYQIDTQTFTAKTITAPSKRILDAVYDDINDYLYVSYSNESGFIQLDEEEQPCDISIYHYNDEPSQKMFTYSKSIYTNLSDEVDNNDVNLNNPFKLTIKSVIDSEGEELSKLFVSKKNEIVLLSNLNSAEIDIEHLYYSRDNFFNKGISYEDKVVFLNSFNSGLEEFEYDIETDYFNMTNTLRTSYPVYNTVFNSVNRKLYFFNRLGTEKTGLYIYDLTTETQQHIPTSRAIGDLVYNPINNHILVSEYGPSEGSGAILKIYNSEMTEIIDTKTYTLNNYPGRMFYAPNGKIYITMNAHMDGFAPTIKVLDASTYETLQNISSGLDIEYSNSNTFQSFYCYNPNDECVYVTVSPYYQGHVIQPYQTSYNTNLVTNLFPFESNLEDSWIGKLIKIDKNSQVSSFDISPASEIICSDPSLLQNSSDYKGKLFINTKDNLEIFDCNTNSFLDFNNQELENIYDMDYCPINNTLLAYSYEQIAGANDSPDTYLAHIYRVQEDGTYNEIWNHEGLASSITFNKYDGKLYVYFLGEVNAYGGLNSKVFQIDPLDDYNLDLESVDLPNTSLLHEIKPQANYPFFDAYNKAYFPNGVHSSVSVINFEGNEALPLDATVWNWVSFPRTKYHPNNNSIEVVENNIQPFDDVEYANLYNLPFSGNFELSLNYNWQLGWQTDNLQNITNVNGYKLSIDKDHIQDRNLFLKGTIVDPTTTIEHIYSNKENWVGYWHPEPQDAFDALADNLSDLYVIKAENWTCVRDDQIQGPTAPWICDDKNTYINYGEMLVLKSYADIYNFQWNYSSSQTHPEETQSTEYYTYTPTNDYTPIVIEIDSSDNPIEIGAFIGDTCVGATNVEDGDTTLALRTYLNSASGDSLTFEKYYGTKSTSNRIDKYYVYNKKYGIEERRIINPKERSDYIRVSLKTDIANSNINNGKLNFNIYPNPNTGICNVEFYLNAKSKITFQLTDISGKVIGDELIEFKSKGFNSMNINLKNLTTVKLNKGIYILNISTNTENISKKIIIN